MVVGKHEHLIGKSWMLLKKKDKLMNYSIFNIFQIHSSEKTKNLYKMLFECERKVVLLSHEK